MYYGILKDVLGILRLELVRVEGQSPGAPLLRYCILSRAIWNFLEMSILLRFIITSVFNDF